MTQQFRFRQFPAGNPIANLLVVLAGILVISFAITVGFFVFLAVAGFMLVGAATVGIRRWWYLRKMRQQAGRRQRPGDDRPESGRIIEGEYREIRYRESRQDPPGP